MKKFLFQIILKLLKPNFSILSIKKLKRAKCGFWLEPVKEISEQCIVEYKYNSNILKHLNPTTWPPVFKGRLPITKVVYQGEDVTDPILKFAGPLKSEFNSFGLFKVSKRPKLKFGPNLRVSLYWCDFVEVSTIDTEKLFIGRSQIKFNIPQI